jgi:hypothetical protein
VSTRRKAGIVGGLVAVVLAVALVAGGAYAALAEPLEAGSSWVQAAESRDTGIGYEGVPQFQVPFEADGEILWGIGVRNPLLVPVTIRGIRPLLSELAPLVVGEELRLNREDAPSLEPADLRPFEPVELPPGGSVFLVVREQLAACEPAHEAWSPGSGLVRDMLPLDVSVLGIPRSAEVTLPFAILYSAPKGDCPPS